ncbi:MAG: cell division/cell wall cluster transcriptional repressor MraZ [Oscillospiraceae bacterium]|nr:cell division/cell wall cluster transcriptional repressor MraZ [Oscillospiraceae bacterium]
MDGLSGVFRHTMDAKGRLSIPSRLVKALGEPFHIFGSSDGCLNVYTDQRWKQLAEEIEALPREYVREVRRAIYNNAQDNLKADDHGRVLLEKPLRDHAKLQKNIVIVGSGSYAEIWDETEYENRPKAEADVQPRLRELGI